MKIALVGNPNTGKTSLFNKLTGLNQKVGNYPGITVDKKTGTCKIEPGQKAQIIDLPGTYSLNANSRDEEIVAEVLTSPGHEDYPDAVVVVADASNLRRNLLLFTQVYDLGIPVVLALNMVDILDKRKILIDLEGLSQHFNVPVIRLNARKGIGIDKLKEVLKTELEAPSFKIFKAKEIDSNLLNASNEVLGKDDDYRSWLIANSPLYSLLTPEERSGIEKLRSDLKLNPARNRVQETVRRYKYIDGIIDQFVEETNKGYRDISEKLDAIFTHKVWGLLIFLGLLTLIFQAVFSWATWPMEMIEALFANASEWVVHYLPKGAVAELLADGILPGIAGVLVFIPQIAILFAFIALLEETGYMSRVVYLMDRLMRPFGLNGRSVVPLLSGMACAIPAVMATRTIESWKERLITIMVTPFMTCSARLPVYTIIIALVIPKERLFGFLNLQGLVLMAMYLFGFLMALLAALAFDRILKAQRRGYLILEMPAYKLPHLRNVGITIFQKVRSFVFEAGKIIIAISIILWIGARYGPADRQAEAIADLESRKSELQLSEAEFEARKAAVSLEHSYMGIFGKSIEPAIEPLGYDWKIGIALIASFAAREVFVGTMATIYAVGDTESELTVKEHMAKDINRETMLPRYTLAVGISLLVFYALAMQCMSTLAVVYRETKGWKWPIIQFTYMSGLAYVLSFIFYQLFK